jgi:hypothetical protein
MTASTKRVRQSEKLDLRLTAAAKRSLQAAAERQHKSYRICARQCADYRRSHSDGAALDRVERGMEGDIRSEFR